jgi:hypothetical protein
MTYQEVKEWVDAEPFEPFRIVMTDGKEFDVVNPNLLWPGLTSVMYGYPAAEDPDIYARHKTLSMMHIVRIEPLVLAEK